jgi:hypothetical protein
MEQLQDSEFAKALLTAAGGEHLSPQIDAFSSIPYNTDPVKPRSTTVVKWGVVWSLTVFVILALLPAWWVGRRRTIAAPSTNQEPNAGVSEVGVAADASAIT